MERVVYSINRTCHPIKILAKSYTECVHHQDMSSLLYLTRNILIVLLINRTEFRKLSLLITKYGLHSAYMHCIHTYMLNRQITEAKTLNKMQNTEEEKMRSFYSAFSNLYKYLFLHFMQYALLRFSS